MNVMNDCTVPTIVGIHGYCIGGGIDFITSADIRYCTEDANFCIKEVDIGMYSLISIVYLGQQTLVPCNVYIS